MSSPTSVIAIRRGEEIDRHGASFTQLVLGLRSYRIGCSAA